MARCWLRHCRVAQASLKGCRLSHQIPWGYLFTFFPIFCHYIYFTGKQLKFSGKANKISCDLVPWLLLLTYFLYISSCHPFYPQDRQTAWSFLKVTDFFEPPFLYSHWSLCVEPFALSLCLMIPSHPTKFSSWATPWSFPTTRSVLNSVPLPPGKVSYLLFYAPYLYLVQSNSSSCCPLLPPKSKYATVFESQFFHPRVV